MMEAGCHFYTLLLGYYHQLFTVYDCQFNYYFLVRYYCLDHYLLLL